MPEARLAAVRRTLGAEIRDRRRAAGLSQADLGRPLTRAYVGMLEAGQTLPSIPALILIAERLGITADELIRVVNGS
ncbi:MAG TPA: helix-turn-helix transcriptional regulator [Candidatus Limnocylindrales bacterium]|nr:helix-turn-helix transcriptional regulator [Candidatus Limnocylindrales bacterium]